ncbi:hypothetical protein VTN96DRAFT_3291 [Rasamsonia emersonii]
MDPRIVHLLACEGVVEGKGHNGQDPRFQFVFKLPEGSSRPQSLRTVLMTPCSTYLLSERIDLAVSLARSLIFLHNSHFVHKNIRPETIILLTDDHSKKDRLGKPFLIGFEELRSEDSYTFLRGDDVAERNFYRHPHRQGLVAQESYNVCHDIYSLGVCLLEIGLWTSFVRYSDGEVGESWQEISRLFRSELNLDKTGRNFPDWLGVAILYYNVSDNSNLPLCQATGWGYCRLWSYKRI